MTKKQTTDKKVTENNPDTLPKNTPRKKAAKKAAKRAVKKRGRKLRQMMCQHIPRPENFSIAGCGIDIYFEHLTYIPDLDNDTVAYLDKERVCKKCRKVYKLDSILSKRKRRK